jgi:DNA-binding transcriptional LysR family regulator
LGRRGDTWIEVEIEKRHMRQIVALASHGSFAAAARALGLSQPALTRSIQGLERELGVRLFERHRRGVTATAVGELVVARAREILNGMLDLEHEVALLHGLGPGLVRVGAGPAGRVALVPLAVARFCDRHPRARVELVLGAWRELTRALLEREIDFFVGERSEAEGDPRFEVAPLRSVAGVWVCRAGHPLLARGTLRLHELAEYPLAIPSIPDRMQELLGALAKAGWIRCEDVLMLRAVVLASNAVGLQAWRSVREELERGRLAALPVEDFRGATRPGVVWLRQRKLSSIAADLVDELRAADASLEGAPEDLAPAARADAQTSRPERPSQ